MLKIGKMSDYATVLLAEMAAQPTRDASAADLSLRTQLPAPTVAKILKQLHRADLLQSTRGAGGGYRLARAPEAISIASVLSAVEGPLGLTACASGRCTRDHFCGTRQHWRRINGVVLQALQAMSLADLASTPATSAFPAKIRAEVRA
jgi:FeS assembly SUF system regulator